jgi:hypothetical protein
MQARARSETQRARTQARAVDTEQCTRAVGIRNAGHRMQGAQALQPGARPVPHSHKLRTHERRSRAPLPAHNAHDCTRANASPSALTDQTRGPVEVPLGVGAVGLATPNHGHVGAGGRDVARQLRCGLNGKVVKLRQRERGAGGRPCPRGPFHNATIAPSSQLSTRHTRSCRRTTPTARAARPTTQGSLPSTRHLEHGTQKGQPRGGGRAAAR